MWVHTSRQLSLTVVAVADSGIYVGHRVGGRIDYLSGFYRWEEVRKAN